MKHSHHLLSMLFIACISLPVMAAEAPATMSPEVNNFLQSVFNDNTDYVNRIAKEDFKALGEGQKPRATVVSCSDSRIQSDAYHKSPVNDLFYIRNIGNQIITSEGSVEYGVYHLNTPILLIIGHSNCGAIHAALGDYSKELAPIRHELDQLHLPKSTNTNKGVIENVNRQVAYALTKFKDKVDKKELIVVGTVYDFRDDYNHGHGRLILINLNGEQDPAKIKQDPALKGVDAKAIGID